MRVLLRAGVDLRVPLYNWKREEVGSTLLAGGVFNVEVRKDLLYRVVRWQLARRQQVRPPRSPPPLAGGA
jgi:ribosomal protein L4